MITIGITGGIGSGKTLVCKILEQLAYPVFYADDVAKELMNTDPKLKSQIRELFGDAAYLDSGLNRAFLAEKIFNNETLRKKLNALVHPAVHLAFENWKSQQEARFIFYEAALILETASHKRFDQIWLVTADLETRIRRIMKRDSFTREQVLSRISNQLTDEEKIPLATKIIRNNETELILPQVLEALK